MPPTSPEVLRRLSVLDDRSDAMAQTLVEHGSRLTAVEQRDRSDAEWRADVKRELGEVRQSLGWRMLLGHAATLASVVTALAAIIALLHAR